MHERSLLYQLEAKETNRRLGDAELRQCVWTYRGDYSIAESILVTPSLNPSWITPSLDPTWITPSLDPSLDDSLQRLTVSGNDLQPSLIVEFIDE